MFSFTRKRWVLFSSAARVRTACRLFFCIALAATVAPGCGWTPGSEHSVRFYNGYRDLDRLPPIAGFQHIAPNDRFWNESNADQYDDSDGDRANTIDDLWTQAQQEREDGQLSKYRTLLGEYLASTEAPTWNDWQPPKDLQERRNSAVDQLDALKGLAIGARVEDIKAYLAARTAFDIDGTIEYRGAGPQIADNFAYLHAAELYADHEFEDARRQFAAIPSAYPGSEKRDAAQFMVGVCAMKQSLYYQPSGDCGCGFVGEDDSAYDDPNWVAAMKAFALYEREYPEGRFAPEARGWRAYLFRQANDDENALAIYYRMLASPTDREREEAVHSLGLIRRHTSAEHLRAVERRIENQPDIALAYAYFELENGFERLEDVNLYSDDYEKAEDEAARQNTERIAAFAERTALKYRRTPAGNALLVRAAIARYELGAHADAARLAKTALAGTLSTEERTRALWTLGCAEQELGALGDAASALERLLASNPAEPLAENTRRRLAMIAEDAGDLETALDYYLALDYQLDVAYFVDVLMPVDTLAHYVEAHPTHPRRDALLYALGVRHLRDGQLDLARAAYQQIHTVEPYEGRSTYDDYSNEFATSHPDAKDPFAVDWSIPGVRTRWVARDLATIEDLESFARRERAIRDPESKAEIRYQHASYLFEASDLAFYNPEAWRGVRTEALIGYALYDVVRQPNEDQTIWKHFRRHEPTAQSIDMFLSVADEFPDTQAARDALYSAAVADLRIRNYNAYWRWSYQAGRHAGVRPVDFGDVRAKYPTYQMPRGTWKWEPSTRTVNGGPGWDAPPKPEPSKPRWERGVDRIMTWTAPALAWVESGWTRAVAAWRFNTALQWFGLIMCLCLLACFRAAASGARLSLDLASVGPTPRALLPASTGQPVRRLPGLSLVEFADGDVRSDVIAFFRMCRQRVIWFAWFSTTSVRIALAAMVLTPVLPAIVALASGLANLF